MVVRANPESMYVCRTIVERKDAGNARMRLYSPTSRTQMTNLL